ncbi:hypothetical protein CDD81_8137 [Ophiocordyceps australis]|uniref:RNA helicase n=1 Tax=Ophiocordyceps australis TaxID=1399860 RepID=A0A2C5Y309_9HYPO|nr:hypothetical protein CDD81_8137 [Ophiocordyceps australis]
MENAENEATFADLGLDPRLVQAVASQNYLKPTLVQRKAIPLALNGQDVLCKAKTGSGKTAAYVLPVLAGILKRKSADSNPATSALILVPSRELADQVFRATEDLSSFCASHIKAVKLTDKLSDAAQRSLLSTRPDIIISTPARAWNHVKSNDAILAKLSCLVLDEADLLLSYGYNEDLENLSWSMPKGVQTIMMSATLTDEVELLKKVFYRNNVPALLDLQEPDVDGEGVTQLYTKCGEDEKFLLAYVIFKLQLVKGKCIIFVGEVDRCYRLKLFLEQFGIRSCILNSELPVNSRLHVVDEFNRNVYDLIIASDDKEVIGNEENADDAQGGDEHHGADGHDGEKKQRPRKKRKMRQEDKEYGVSRGIDFKNVAAVINFDLPKTASSYTHRIGRTGRAGRAGLALSFVVPKQLYRQHMATWTPTAEHDEKVLARIMRRQADKDKELQAYNFDAKQIEAFRYRMNDALRAVTQVAVREARTRELRQELVKSEKLTRYFEENPSEMKHLRHDGELRTARQQAHLRHIPDYLMPKEGRKGLSEQQVGRNNDPLKTLKARRLAK